MVYGCINLSSSKELLEVFTTGEELMIVKTEVFSFIASGISGTAPYMSPEMLGRKRYNTQTDAW